MKYIKTNAAGIHYRRPPVFIRLTMAYRTGDRYFANKEPMPSVMYDGMVVTLQIPKERLFARISTRYGNWIHVPGVV
jgi:hypothetical protein